MKELNATATAEVHAPPERCLQLLGDVERYPTWYPEVVRRVEAIERAADGAVTQARTSLHVPNVPLVSDVALMLAVAVDPPDVVRLTRIAHGRGDEEKFEVTWRLIPDGSGTTRIDLELHAKLSVPRLVPTGGIGNALAGGFVSAAARALGPDPVRSGAEPGH